MLPGNLASAAMTWTRANCPGEDGPDSDFGQPPILVELGGGQRALVIAQKSGMVHAIDPDAEGKVLWQTRVGRGGLLGGSLWGSAADTQRAYVAISDAVLHSVAGRIALDRAKGEIGRDYQLCGRGVFHVRIVTAILKCAFNHNRRD